MKQKRILELDGIRGIAILLVLVWHYFVILIAAAPGTPLSYLRAAGRLTWSGVDLFFVLSGFLIGGILLEARDSPDYFRTFYTRRFFRIVPLYLIWFTISCVVMRTATGQVGAWVHRDTFSMWPYLLYLQNFWMAAKDTLTSYSAGGTWSLAIEEQFYLTLPLIIRFAPRRILPWVIGFGIISAPIIRSLIYVLLPHNRMALFVLMPARADSLLFGVAGAMLVRSESGHLWLKNNKNAMSALLLLLAGGIAYLVKSDAKMQGFTMSAAGFTWLAAFYLGLILFAVTHVETRLAALLRFGPLRWLGTIAYGVYLFHIQLLIGVYAILWGVPPFHLSTGGEWAAVSASLVLTITICSASWIYFEKPLVTLGHGWNYKKGFHETD